MPISGIEIFKLLPGGQKPPSPKANCRECGMPTCMAFGMKLAAKQVELSACPYVSDESKAKLEASSVPPIRLITLKGAGTEIKVGNEICLYRHEKTFYNRPGLFVRVKASQSDLAAVVEKANAYKVSYVGTDFGVSGFAVEADGSADAFAAVVKTVRSLSKLPVILMSGDAAVLAAGAAALPGETPLLCGADAANWEAVAAVAAKSKLPLVVTGDSLDALSELTEKIKAKGVEDLVLNPIAKTMGASLAQAAQIRRLALKNFHALGYPLINLACNAGSPERESLLAAQAVAKYAGFIVLDQFTPELVYALLVLRENIYTDPQKPIQVLPGIYEINHPTAASPVLVTTNFSITYFSVANEVEGAGLPAWLLVTDAEGMSVLTAWAAGKFDSERIAKAVKSFNIESKISKKRICIPGHVAVLSGELEEELPGWEIKVGPREAVDLPAFIKQVLN
ncbi:MAG: acetyl-CoA decarbonylase/synthase complex subunit gamma [Anaerolineaceae bacterium]|nr:acetyl-CoA decarbonylase/synthase complex subunit gamma [Anaerolineaceae bacterium]